MIKNQLRIPENLTELHETLNNKKGKVEPPKKV